MKSWGDWSVARHQVAIGGRVTLGEQPCTGAHVSIVTMPREFEFRIRTAQRARCADWDELDMRPDKTVSRADGTFYFLDLPTGDYGVRCVDPQTRKQMDQSASVRGSKDEKIQMAFLQFELGR